MNTRRTLAIVIFAALVLSSLPYALGYFISSPERQFMGLTYNIDDACVYLSWMRQAADGHASIRNQFTVEPQKAFQINVLFLVLGWLARITHLPLIAIYHLARILFGALLLWMIYVFGGRFLKDDKGRLALAVLAAFSSGIGWLFGSGTSRSLPIDLWQPEAITFLSLYLNPLFLCAQVLILGILMCLLRCKDTGMGRYALAAGLLLLLLANAHTYDVVTTLVVWTTFLAITTIIEKRVNYRLISLSSAAAIIAMPALLYQIHLYRTEEVFRLRVETAAPSPAVWCYFAGYGLVLLLAIVGSAAIARRRAEALLPVVWAVVGFILPYAPFSQQRKLVMGLHIPLTILAVCGIVWLAQRWQKPVLGLALVATFIALPSNLVFLWRDSNWLIHNQTATQMNRPFLSRSEIAGLQWLNDHARGTDSVLALPDVACFVPALTGARTYVGHWSETPYFGEKLREWRDFASASEDEESRIQFLRKSQTTYVWWDKSLNELPSKAPGYASEAVFNPRTAKYLREVFHSGAIRIYRADL